MTNIRPNAPEILNFEKKFREMIYEIQRNTRELENLEKERLLMREELYTKTSLLQDERKVSNDLRTRLKLASETINRAEEEKMRDKMNYSSLSLDFESLLKERAILRNETRSCQAEAARCKFKIESLENALQKESRQREKLEKALTELKTENEKIIANIDISFPEISNLAKISKEQRLLFESAKSIIRLNRRLQTFGLCFHAINERNRGEIKNLQHKLIAISASESQVGSADKLHPEIENLCFKLKETLTGLKTKMQDSAPFEEKLNKIFDDLSRNFTQIEERNCDK